LRERELAAIEGFGDPLTLCEKPIRIVLLAQQDALDVSRGLPPDGAIS
jgi:hypothetical protein